MSVPYKPHHIARSALDLLHRQFEGVQHVAAEGVVSISRFHHDPDAHRLGCLVGTLLEDESEVVWQPMIVDGSAWYLGAEPEAAPGSFDNLVDRVDQIDWVQVDGTGLATSPLGVLYWLFGVVDAAAEAAPSETSSDGLAWLEVTVSVRKAIDEASALGDLGVAESFEQAGVSQDPIRLHVGLDDAQIAGVMWSDRSEFVADHRFWPTQQPRSIPVPNHTARRSLADYFALLGERNPLARGSATSD